MNGGRHATSGHQTSHAACCLVRGPVRGPWCAVWRVAHRGPWHVARGTPWLVRGPWRMGRNWVLGAYIVYYQQQPLDIHAFL
jgi:hypothetical protein